MIEERPEYKESTDDMPMADIAENEKKKSGSKCCGCCWRRKDKSTTVSFRDPTAPGPGLTPSELATDLLPLRSRKEREQVQKALEEELTRQRAQRAMHRQRKYAERFAAGPPGRGEPGFRLFYEGQPDDEPPLDPSPEAYQTDVDVDAATVWVDKPVSLDDQRREWVRKMQEEAAASTRTTDQPESLTLDSETAKELAAHTLVNMMRRVMTQSSSEDGSKRESERYRKNRRKSPADMSAEELVRLQHEDPDVWDQFAIANSISSFGLTKPTEEDQKRANRKRAKANRLGRGSRGSYNSNGPPRRRSSRNRVHFSDEMDVVAVPVGQDFHINEHREYKVAPVKRQ